MFHTDHELVNPSDIYNIVKCLCDIQCEIICQCINGESVKSKIDSFGYMDNFLLKVILQIDL